MVLNPTLTQRIASKRLKRVKNGPTWSQIEIKDTAVLPKPKLIRRLEGPKNW